MNPAMSSRPAASEILALTLCAEADGVWPANFNCPGQVVVSGTKAALEAQRLASVALDAARIRAAFPVWHSKRFARVQPFRFLPYLAAAGRVVDALNDILVRFSTHTGENDLALARARSIHDLILFFHRFR